MRDKFILLFYAVIIFIIGFYGIFFTAKIFLKNNPEAEIVQVEKSINLYSEEVVSSIKETVLYFVGDIMLARGVKNSVIKNFNGNYDELFKNLNELKNADILFGNLEGPISNKGNNVGSKYSFRMDTKVLPVLKDAGFDILSFANNHVGDWNINAFKDTLAQLNKIGILKIGAGLNKNEAEEPTIIEKNNIKFGFIGFSDVGPNHLEAKINTAGILLANDLRLTEIIQKAKEKCDILIISFHWGEEYKKIHNKRQEVLAYQAIDAGADLIIGHHPHVIQDIEIYKDKIIVYSLGNFIFDQYFSKETMQGLLFIARYSGTTLIETKQKLIKLNKFYQPEEIFDFE